MESAQRVMRLLPSFHTFVPLLSEAARWHQKPAFYAFLLLFGLSRTRIKIAYKHPSSFILRQGLFYGRLIILWKKIAHWAFGSGALFLSFCFARPHNIIGGFLFERWMLAHVFACLERSDGLASPIQIAFGGASLLAGREAMEENETHEREYRVTLLLRVG